MLNISKLSPMCSLSDSKGKTMITMAGTEDAGEDEWE